MRLMAQWWYGWYRVGDHFLIECEVCSKGNFMPGYCNPGQKLMAGEVTNPQIDFGIFILLNVRVTNLPSKYLCL